jgi:multiple sugar transport system permease protein
VRLSDQPLAFDEDCVTMTSLVATQTSRQSRRRTGSLRRNEALTGLLFVLPWIIGLLVFTAYPIISSVYLSFTDYSIVKSPRWVGLDNYRTMFSTDPLFWTAVKNSAWFAIVSVPLRLAIAFLLALLLSLNVKFISAYRTFFYLPALVPPVAGTIVFILMFDARNGLLNQGLGLVGIDQIGWLTDPTWSKPAIVILSLWGLGVDSLIFLAGLKDIPQDLIEAASLDGAGPWQRMLRITLPLITPIILFNLVMGVIGSFQVFTQALVIGGPDGRPLDSTLMYMVLIYRNAFRYFSMGYASALSVVLFLAVLAVTLVIFRSSRWWVYYEGDSK